MKKDKLNKHDLCICGHVRDEHEIGPLSKVPICYLCRELDWPDEYHEFKFDNFNYIKRVHDARHRK